MDGKIIKILMVDDHPSMLEGYKIILGYNELGYEIQTTSVHTCKAAYEIITNPVKCNFFDLAFLDYSLPEYEEKNIRNGEDLGSLIKEYSPETKIAILTSHTESILIFEIIKNIDPEGILIKSDFSADELIKAFDLICKGSKYYSQTVRSITREIYSQSILDKINLKILKLISEGVKTKNLPGLLEISQSAVEKRKMHLREFLKVIGGNDEDIIKAAKKRGLV